MKTEVTLIDTSDAAPRIVARRRLPYATSDVAEVKRALGIKRNAPCAIHYSANGLTLNFPSAVCYMATAETVND